MGIPTCLYLRYSDTSQRDGTSFATQKSACDIKCKNEGYSYTDDLVIKDDAVSADPGKSDYTKRVEQLLEFCRKNKARFKILMVFNLDRFARDTREHLYLRDKLSEIGIMLRSATENLGESYSDRFVETVMAAKNELDNNMRRKRSKDGLWMRVEEGLWPWPPPLGYRLGERNLGSNGKVTLVAHVVDKNCATAIVEIFKKYSTGTVSKSELSRQYKDRGIRDYKNRLVKFSPQLIDKILSKKYYAGYVTHNTRGDITGQHTRIIDLPLYEKCQKEIKEKSNNRTKKRNRYNPLFSLRHFAKCPNCGEFLTAANQKLHTQPLYWCYAKGCNIKYKTYRKLDIDNAFYDFMSLVKPTEELTDRFINKVLEKYKILASESDNLYREKAKEIVKLQSDKEWIIEKSKKGIFDDETLKEELEKNKTAIELAKFELQNIHKKEEDINSMLAQAKEFIRTIENTWYNAEIDTKVRLQKWLFPGGVTLDWEGDKLVFRTQKINRLFKLISTIGTTSVSENQQLCPRGESNLRQPA